MTAQTQLARPRARRINELFQNRIDQQLQGIVNHGIALQIQSNTVCALEYLKSHNVDPGVIERVLLHPEQRRKSSH